MLRLIGWFASWGRPRGCSFVRSLQDFWGVFHRRSGRRRGSIGSLGGSASGPLETREGLIPGLLGTQGNHRRLEQQLVADEVVEHDGLAMVWGSVSPSSLPTISSSSPRAVDAFGTKMTEKLFEIEMLAGPRAARARHDEVGLERTFWATTSAPLGDRRTSRVPSRSEGVTSHPSIAPRIHAGRMGKVKLLPPARRARRWGRRTREGTWRDPRCGPNRVPSGPLARKPRAFRRVGWAWRVGATF